MDGYYDHHATLNLRRHVVLASYVTEDTRLVAQRVASLYGLPFADLDRKVEHHAGMSVWELVLRQGVRAYRELEERLLRQELAASPFGLVALGDGALVDPRLRRHVADAADVVFLDLDLPALFWRLKRLSSRREEHELWHPLFAGHLDSLDDVRPYYLERLPGSEAAHHTIGLAGKGLVHAQERLEGLVTSLAG